MDIYEAIRHYSAQPLTHQLMMALLYEYKRPNDKVYALIKEGALISVRKGLYIAGPAVTTNTPEPFLLANHIYGPSYVSLDKALSYYGLIPERVYDISSVTMKDSKRFKTPIGLFSYTHLPLPYYSFGIRQVKLSDEQYAMVASPEKALFDKIVTSAGMILRSPKGVLSYLVEDLRIDEDNLKELDTQTMLQWLTASPKKDSLWMIIKTIDTL